MSNFAYCPYTRLGFIIVMTQYRDNAPTSGGIRDGRARENKKEKHWEDAK